MSHRIKIFSVLLLFSFVMFSACSEDSSADDRFPNVDERLWPLFEEFEIAAANHGLDLNLVALEITGEIENIAGGRIAGTCRSGENIAHITVDLPFWTRSSPFEREMLIFHELGHCVLDRGHLEDEDNTGRCVSLMNSGTSGCNIVYNANSRDFYLEELFSN